MREAALAFSACSKSHEVIDTDHSLNCLCHKQLIWKVTTTKFFVKPEELPPTNSASRYHSFQRHFQITQKKEGSNIRATEWCWAVKSNKFIPVLTDLEVVTQYILKIIRCLCKVDCSSAWCKSWQNLLWTCA